MSKNVCIVGYGAIGPVHADSLSKTDTAKFYAICDINAEKIKLCLEKYEVISYTDFDKMLKNENIHSVHICTPHHLHFEMTKKALLAGKEVVLEKPSTRTKEEFSALFNLKGSENIKLVFQNRFNPCIQKFKEITENKKYGAIVGAKAFLTWARDINYYNSDEWRGKWDTEGGGVLINQAVHTLDYFNYVTGGIKSVKASMSNFSIDGIEVEDTVSAYLNLNCGASGVFFATNAYKTNSSPEFEIIFENGVVKYSEGALFENGKVTEEDSKAFNKKNYWGIGHSALIKNIYDGGISFGLNDAENTMNAVFAIYESAKNSQKEVIV